MQLSSLSILSCAVITSNDVHVFSVIQHYKEALMFVFAFNCILIYDNIQIAFCDA